MVKAKKTGIKSSAVKAPLAMASTSSNPADVLAETVAKSAAASSPRSTKGITANTPMPKVVTDEKPVSLDPAMRKKDLIDAVTLRSGIKRKDAKPVVEAMLAVLGEAIADGRELNLQPLGKVKINRTKLASNGRVITVRVRQSLSYKSGPKDPVDIDNETATATAAE